MAEMEAVPNVVAGDAKLRPGLVVLVNGRTVKRMKPGVTLDGLRAKYPGMTFTRVGRPWPSQKTLERWVSDSIVPATDGCRVEPDGVCPHGQPSWLMALGLI